MEIKRGSTANESINLQRESATGHCGRKWHLRRRDVRTAAICKAMRKRALPWSGVVADVRTALLRAGGVDGNSETRRGTISLFNGPEPVVKILDDPEREAMAVTKLLVAKGARRSSAPRIRGLCPIVCAVGSRPRRCAATGIRFRLLDENVETVTGQISIGTMHLAPGFGISRRSGYGL